MCWGSNRLNAPEDSIKGEVLDRRTNVYNIGATAFSLIGGELDRSIEKWEGTEALYKVAQVATKENRNDRFGSVAEFYREWKRGYLNMSLRKQNVVLDTPLDTFFSIFIIRNSILHLSW